MSAEVRPFEANGGGPETEQSMSLVTNMRVTCGTAVIDPNEARV